MIRGIREPPDAERTWSVYMVRCSDGSLYTGAAKGVDERVAKHNAGRGAAYTRPRRPVRLVYREDGLTRSEALVREAGIKSLPKPGKEILVGGPRLISKKKRGRIAHRC
ncbi:MAG: GIY-YIG nuclease family protein [Elusimicrobia bacterium]|nr:GIY-YIG nuclease family protein [Elusimicrobiota bacterium]